MDTHDLARDREPWPAPLQRLPAGALVIAISSDGLFTLSELRDLARHMPDARLEVIDSPEGHDGFLLEFEQLDALILAHLRDRLPELYAGPPLLDLQAQGDGFEVSKTSVFGEAEADVSRW